jgi:formyl-CoA transferase
LTAFSAILRALLQRGKTGQGVDLKISMFDVMADWMNMPLLAHRYMGGAPDRMGLKHSFIAPYGAFRCANGALILISVQNNREFTALCEQVLQQPQLPTDPRFSENTARYANRIALEAIVNAVFEGFSSAEMVQKLDAAKIANARLNSVAELSEHPFLKNSNAIIGGMPIDMAALPVATMGGTAKGVPDLNADGAALRHEFSLPSQHASDIP